MEHLKYPIGKFQRPESWSPEQLKTSIHEIGLLPEKLKIVAGGLSETQLDTPYRPEGWTGRQVIHHMADSHMNAYIRFKWTLTEDTPTIKAYHEKAWAELPEAKTAPVAASIAILEALHRRWGMMMDNLKEADWHRGFVHPESGKHFPLYVVAALYAWHGNHHLGHLGLLLDE